MKHVLPLLAWLLFLVLAGREFCLNHWEGALVAFAALALVPQGLELAGFQQEPGLWAASGSLALAYVFYPHPMAAYAALPYLVLALWVSVREATNLFVFKHFQLLAWVRLAALVYWATGAVWAFCFLASIQPLGFDAVIVGLTAAHFHVAGFVLAVVVYCLLRHQSNAITSFQGWTTLFGMPLVAAGITLTKLGFSPVFEWVSAFGFVVFGLSIVLAHIRLALKATALQRVYFVGAALCLLPGVLLAALYALRFNYPLEWVNIPNMKIWHGTLNAAGFGWMVLQGWSVQRGNENGQD